MIRLGGVSPSTSLHLTVSLTVKCIFCFMSSLTHVVQSSCRSMLYRKSHLLMKIFCLWGSELMIIMMTITVDKTQMRIMGLSYKVVENSSKRQIDDKAGSNNGTSMRSSIKQ